MHRRAPSPCPSTSSLPDEEAATLEASASALFSEGEDANTYSDIYTMSTLLFAIVLFFAAISERFDYFPMRVLLLSLAAVGLVAGLAVAVGQPITTG